MIMQAALSSVNFGSNPKPSFVKKSIDLFRSRTARLTNIFRGLLSAMVSSLVRFVRRFGVEEGGHPGDAIPRHLEHDERPRLPALLPVLPERRQAARRRRHETGPAASRASSEE